MKIKIEYIVVGFGVLLFALCVWLFVLWRQEKANSAGAMKLNDIVIGSAKKVITKQKQHAESRIKVLEHGVDSLHIVLNVTEKLRKENNNFSDKKIHEIKVFTVDARKHYVDSLFRANRLGH